MRPSNMRWSQNEPHRRKELRSRLQPSDKEFVPTRRVRWWPLVVIILMAVLAFIWIGFFFDGQRQDRNLRTVLVVLLGTVGSIIWFLAFSRLTGKIRSSGLAILIGAVGLVVTLIRFRGVTGDFIPVPEWRWRGHEDRPLLQPMDADGSLYIPDRVPYPQFLGPRRNATVTGFRLVSDLEAHPPELVWRRSVGGGWSGFAVFGRYAVTQEQRGSDEAVIAYELGSGRELWVSSYQARYESFIAGVGPRATPTISDGRVYALGATGVLTGLDLATGELRWRRNILSDAGSDVPDWGLSGSPLVHEENVIVSAGGSDEQSLIAYHRDTGERIWSGGSDRAHYSSPVLTELTGIPQVLIFNRSGVASHRTSDGVVLWQYPWRHDHPHVCIPVVLPHDRVLLSTGYGHGSEALQIDRDERDRFTVVRVWKSRRLKAKFTNVVFKDGFIYGLDDGVMVCLDAEDGKLRWKGGRFGHGQMILVQNVLLVTAENGEVVLLRPMPDQFRELSRFSAIEGKSWNPPALAGDYLLVRNNIEAACYRMATIWEP